MKFLSIRKRMLLAAVLPALLVTSLLSVTLWVNRMDDLEASFARETSLLIRQSAASSVYGVFFHNPSVLQGIAKAAATEPDVVSMSIFDATGRLMAIAGRPSFQTLQQARALAYDNSKDKKLQLFIQPVSSETVPDDDVYAGPQSNPIAIGYVAMEISRQRLFEMENRLIFLTVGISLLGLIVGAIFSLQLGEGVIRPVLRISRMIERLGKGDFRPSLDVPDADPFYDLQVQLNEMARRLALSREELERRVADVTHELRLKKDEAETATAAKSRFIAAASHDLRQPTHALGMFVARLKQLELTPQIANVVNNLEASLEAMQDLLDGLLDLSRLESGTVQTYVEAIELNQVFESVHIALRSAAQMKNLKFRVLKNKYWIQSDTLLLKQILINLVTNAIRYTNSGTVLLGCRRIGDRTLRVDVYDTGVGIDPKHSQVIFQEFYQIGNFARDRNQGVGLGLSIVQRTAKLLGHHVELQSTLGKGSRFSVFVPLIERQYQAPQMVDTWPIDSELIGMHVVLIEDDDLARQSVVDLLQSWGCTVSSFTGIDTFNDALAHMHRPEVVITDYRLSDKGDGFTVIEKARSHFDTGVPACLISGDTDPELIAQVQIRNLTLLNKPVRPAKLRSFLRRQRSTSV